MKKTLTVNLGGTVYHIDEDAYVLLDNYLNNLRYYFRREEGAEEIVRDIENRIGELFDEYLRNGQQVITVENVKAVIERMGKPEQLDEETPESESSAGTRREERPRRLFRDPDDRVLGGVASGLAAYFNWDPMWVRIALILLAIPVHGLILVYLIAWIVIPVAHTATEKLQMHGRTISMENIGRTVTDSFERVNDYVRSDKPRSILHRIGSGIVQMVGLLMRLVLILIAICLAPVLFAGIVTVFALIMAATGILISVPAFVYNAFPYINWELVASSSGMAVGLAVCLLLVVCIPFIGLLQLIFQGLKIWGPMSTTAKVVWVILWFVALGAGIILFIQAPYLNYPYHFLL